ncbi:ankyrin repeat-containing domain protein [Diaporthe sp. PMI_573]|nr:ankyrin repeat-containing domain protein [Diaporthaceae sp. PMI_573]
MSDIETCSLEHESPVPRYTETDENGLSARLETFQKSHPDYPIVPVSEYPGFPSAARAIQADIVKALFISITARDAAAVHHLISAQGLISPDCPSAKGETPLLASIRARSAPTARTLLALGADPNLVGKGAAAPPRDHEDVPSDSGGITPLMLASATGQLAIVKMLVDDFGADDAIVGARGETALWLAARAGHRDVVAYLPTRRAGAWRRLRHSKELRALRKAVVTTGEVVKFLGWTVPRGLVFDIPRAVGKFAWRRRRRILALVVRVVKGFPRVLKDLAKGVWAGIKELPREVWRVVVWVSRAVPRAWEVVWKWLVDGVRKVSGAVVFAAQRLVSVLHSFFVAVINRLREVKLKDLGHDLLVALEALFVKLPGAVWSFMAQSVTVFRRAVKAVFRSDWVRFFLYLVFSFVCIVPRTLWMMLESLWACVGRGVEELISLLNPKMVPSKRGQPWTV